MDNFFPNPNCNACPPQNDITVGVILDVNRQNRSFSTISNGNPFSIIQFNVPNNAFIFDRFGRPLDFNRLTPGMPCLGTSCQLYDIQYSTANYRLRNTGTITKKFCKQNSCIRHDSS